MLGLFMLKIYKVFLLHLQIRLVVRIDSFDDMVKTKKTKEYGGEKGKDRLKRMVQEKGAVQYQGKVVKKMRLRGSSHEGESYQKWDADNMRRGKDSFERLKRIAIPLTDSPYIFFFFAACEMWFEQEQLLQAGMDIPKKDRVTMKGLSRTFDVPFTTLQ